MRAQHNSAEPDEEPSSSEPAAPAAADGGEATPPICQHRGDFWHGWRFESWRMKLSEKWEVKIATNRRRDDRNRRLLRWAG